MASNTQLPSSLSTPPPPVPDTLLLFPRPHVLLVKLNRPKQLNAIPPSQHFAFERLWDWFDAEPSLRVAVLTGAGRAFCAGADLKEWDGANSSSDSAPESGAKRFPVSGFGGMSNRGGLKPIIAAVNGICFGGGMEMVINCDIVVASATEARFGLPEVTIGVIALAGALPRLVRTVGRQRAAEMALGGKNYGAKEMQSWGLVNQVVEGGSEAVLEAALKWAERIAGNSPDAVIVSREGLKLGWESVGPEQGTDLLVKGWYKRIDKGENMIEGVKSFVERRKPVWKNSKL
ncbi:putative enoyl-CoA hydratase [Hypoxylon sp. FL0890]|nr:putative enoyl-CoA hydratase [Hypoxylon sp. FL0890]